MRHISKECVALSMILGHCKQRVKYVTFRQVITLPHCGCAPQKVVAVCSAAMCVSCVEMYATECSKKKFGILMFSQVLSHLLCISSPVNIQIEVTHPVGLCFSVLHSPVFLVTCSQKVSQPQHWNKIGILYTISKLLKSAQNVRSWDLCGWKFDFGAKRLLST